MPLCFRASAIRTELDDAAPGADMPEADTSEGDAAIAAPDPDADGEAPG